MRALNAGAYPSGGAGMVGDADDVLKLVEALRSGGQGILQPDTVALLRSPHVGAQAQTQGPAGDSVLAGRCWWTQKRRRRRSRPAR